MTADASDSPRPAVPSSNRILRTTLRWGGLVTLVLAVLAAAVGGVVAGLDGMWSGLAGVLLAAVFLAITAISILIANRWYGDVLYVPIFFGVVLGGWILKLVIFLVVLLVLRGQPWISPVVFFLSVVVSVVAALVVDAVVLLKMRMPYVSDVELPGERDSAEGTGSADS